MAKTVTDNQLNGEMGESIVKVRVGRLGHVFEPRGRLETGIDGTIDFRDPRTGQMLGTMVAVQVKTRGKGNYTAETGAAFEYLMRAADIEFWRRSSLPVVLVLYRMSDDSFFWKDVTDCAPGEERRLVFDKVADRLDEGSIDRLAAISVKRGHLGTHVPPMRKGEKAHLNLMHVSMPDEILVADSPFSSRRDAVPEMLATDERRMDWVIRGRRFVSFADPRGTGLEAIVDADTVEAVETGLVAASDDPEDEQVMIELLRRTMERQVSDELAYDEEARTFFFRAFGRNEPRKYRYRSLREDASATVVQVYMNKKRKEAVHSVRHHAFKPRFERVGDEWFLSVSPTFVFTEDGSRPHLHAADLLAGKKRMDRNGSIRGQVFMFRHLLSGVGSGHRDRPDDLFQAPAPPAGPEKVLGFEPVDAVEMEVAVPEDAWVVNDPNAKRMRAEGEDDLFSAGKAVGA